MRYVHTYKSCIIWHTLILTLTDITTYPFNPQLRGIKSATGAAAATSNYDASSAWSAFVDWAPAPAQMVPLDGCNCNCNANFSLWTEGVAGVRRLPNGVLHLTDDYAYDTRCHDHVCMWNSPKTWGVPFGQLAGVLSCLPNQNYS